MLRNRQHSRTEQPLWTARRRQPLWTARRRMGSADVKTEVLIAVVDALDLYAFIHKPAYRRRLNDVLAAFSDEEFDSFERIYTRRFTVN